jgi:hypothetical protein
VLLHQCASLCCIIENRPTDSPCFGFGFLLEKTSFCVGWTSAANHMQDRLIESRGEDKKQRSPKMHKRGTEDHEGGMVISGATTGSTYFCSNLLTNVHCGDSTTVPYLLLLTTNYLGYDTYAFQSRNRAARDREKDFKLVRNYYVLRTFLAPKKSFHQN